MAPRWSTRPPFLAALLALATASAVCAWQPAAAAPSEPPPTVQWPGARLQALRAAARNGSLPVVARLSLAALSAEAATALGLGPWAVTNKSVVPASGSKHDYITLGSYWWPCTAACPADVFANCSLWNQSDLGPPGPPYANCSNATGLPWYDHDGYHNPINDNLDGGRLHAMGSAVRALSLAGYLLDNPAYSARAALLLRVFFLDAATAMNPNGEYSQGIPGRCDGRGTGIIDFVSTLPLVLDSAALLPAQAWSASDAAGLREWTRRFLDWQLGSANGQQEDSATNNHGSWYDVLATSLAAHLGNRTVVADTCRAAPARRIDVQVAADGSLPLEDRRTKSENYHTYDATALLTLAGVCARFAPETPSLFAHTGKDGRGLAKMVEWMAPYAGGDRPWPFHQIVSFDRSSFTAVFRMAALAPPWNGTAAAHEALAERQPGFNTSLVNLELPYGSL